ncbi:DUF6298 domain-containing protein [Anditalea andensis]|uniref:Pectate lyase n=1 Tax=Anditalea andensis TaxID=1048983 RepID=A0A074KZB1_9BACT|nr:DUF6298 domain-containing protein [Anditalea andensis]KEO74254.1 pectate lyase [Anditalea andensis]
MSKRNSLNFIVYWKEVLLPIFLLIFFLFFSFNLSGRQSPLSYKGGNLTYEADEKGDRIPDFSYCGYAGSEKAIPNVPARFVIGPQNSDATALIQAAIDEVGTLPVGKNGFRGAVLLEKGTYEIAGQLVFNKSGVVLRGSGAGQGGTILLGSGQDRKTLIRVLGHDDRVFGDTIKITDDYIPVNGKRIHITKPQSLQKHASVYVIRPSTEEWIDELGMKDFGGETGWLGWKPGDHDLKWDRTIVSKIGSMVELDVPITTAIDINFGGGYIIPYQWNGRIENIGIENLSLSSTYDTSNPKDEAHRWMGITMENVQDSWVRQVNFENFAGSAVAIYSSGRRITVEDCKSLNPVSEIGGGRRNTFFTEGQQTLFQRCYSEYGYHDFTTGLAVPGPNAFVQCEAYLPFNFSGGQQGWSSGVLFDMVKIDGNALVFNNLHQSKRGAGWTIANSVIWQSDASKIENFNPPTAQNWAFGVWAQSYGDGYWENVNSHVNPQSLYYAQLEERMEVVLVNPQLMPMAGEASTSPTKEQARELTILAREKIMTLSDWIDQAGNRNPIDLSLGKAKSYEKLVVKTSSPTNEVERNNIKTINGIVLAGDRMLTGDRHQVSWWRGSLRPIDVSTASVHVTRFVPGRYGKGLTDELDEVIEHLKSQQVVALEHNYGLWYDRRRDDHQRVRRMDGDVWPPFYEQPFARSGEGTAWDGLSKYDLTKFNPWYWNRLKEFADKAESEGIILIHQQYFQHNILEAGAHYADFPWRTANNINNTGFSEPVPYAGDKRIFLDEQFYDITHPVRRELHRSYIKKCLDNFADNTNVLQLVSAEYTGPLHFVEFWLDVIREWESETGKKAWIGLSTTKDVQDAILADKERAGLINLIDIRYWYPTEEGVYAPEGGVHLAPRQHARKMSSGKLTSEAVYATIKDYKSRFPDKSVIFSHNNSNRMGWPVLFGGGSLPALPQVNEPGFYRSLATMKPTETQNADVWRMQNEEGESIIYSHKKQTIGEEWRGARSGFEVLMIHPSSGKTVNKSTNKRTRSIKVEAEADQLIWIRKIK